MEAVRRDEPFKSSSLVASVVVAGEVLAVREEMVELGILPSSVVSSLSSQASVAGLSREALRECARRGLGARGQIRERAAWCDSPFCCLHVRLLPLWFRVVLREDGCGNVVAFCCGRNVWQVKFGRGKVRRGILGGKRARLSTYFTRASALVPVRVA
jgi:hypothetical protein